MVRYESVEAAFGDPTAVTELDLSSDETEALLADPARMSTMANLRVLDIVVRELEPAVLAICANVPWLEELEIWGHHLRSGVLPHQIAELRQLERLTIVSCGLYMLPHALSQLPRLRRLHLRGHRFERFPTELTTLGALEQLEFSSCGKLTTLPPELTGMTSLRRLNLSYSLRFGDAGQAHPDPIIGDLFDESPGGPVPEVLGRMPALEDLNLSHCHLDDVGPLRTVTGLRTLVLDGNDITDLSPLAALAGLESLSLSGCTEFTDLTPLRGLPLRHLSLDSCHQVQTVAVLSDVPTLESLNVEYCDAVSDFHTLLNHPALTDVSASELITTMWSRRGEYDELPGTGSIRPALASAQSPAEAERALSALTRVATFMRSGSDGPSPLFDIFGLDPDEFDEFEIVPVPDLDDALTRFGEHLSSDTLVALLRATYASYDDNFRATLLVLEELIRRRDEVAQEAFIAILRAATEYYDSGHRAMDDTVYDALIDDVLPRFEPVPLAKLLIEFGTFDYLMMDSFCGFLDRALAGPLPPELEDEVLGLLWEHSLGDYMGDEWQSVVQDLCDQDLPASVHETLTAVREAQLACAAIRDDLKHGRRIGGHVAEVGHTITAPMFKEIDWQFVEAVRASSMPFDDLWAALTRALAANWPDTSLATLVGLALERDIDRGRAAILADALTADPHSDPIAAQLRWADLVKMSARDAHKSVRGEIRQLARQLRGEPAPEPSSHTEPQAPAEAPRTEPATPAVHAAALKRIGAGDLSMPQLLDLLDRVAREAAPAGPADQDAGVEHELAEAVGAVTHNSIIACLTTSDPSGALALVTAYATVVDRIGHSGRIREAITSMALMTCVLNQAHELGERVLTWVPDNVNLPNLALNLACYHAVVHGGGKQLYDAVRHARRLGVPKRKFLDDSDFVYVIDEPEMRAALDSQP